jgi:hypothetical protein
VAALERASSASASQHWGGHQIRGSKDHSGRSCWAGAADRECEVCRVATNALLRGRRRVLGAPHSRSPAAKALITRPWCSCRHHRSVSSELAAVGQLKCGQVGSLEEIADDTGSVNYSWRWRGVAVEEGVRSSSVAGHRGCGNTVPMSGCGVGAVPSTVMLGIFPPCPAAVAGTAIRVHRLPARKPHHLSDLSALGAGVSPANASSSAATSSGVTGRRSRGSPRRPHWSGSGSVVRVVQHGQLVAAGPGAWP